MFVQQNADTTFLHSYDDLQWWPYLKMFKNEIDT